MFYVYIHCKPDGTPFYVGKGCGERAYTLWHNRNRHYKAIIKKYGRENVKVLIFPCISESDAFSQETDFITAFRAIGYKLANKTNGGEGARGATRSEETRLKMAQSKIGNKYTLGFKRGPMPAEQRAKLSISRLGTRAWNKGIPRTDAERAKMSAVKRERFALRKEAKCQS